MATSITLDGSRYIQFPADDALYNNKGVYVNLVMSLEDWNYNGSSQIVGNYNGQGYGVFYHKGFDDNPDFTVVDSGNTHLFNFNHFGGLITQRSIPNVDAEFTAYMVDHLENKYYFDQANLVCYKFGSDNLLIETSPFPIVADAVISVMVPDKEGNIYFMDTFAQMIHKYDQGGVFISSVAPEQPPHNNMVVLSDGTIKTFYSNAGTPMLTDSDENIYTIWGTNIYKNTDPLEGFEPWFFTNPSTNTINIDMDDNIWVVYQNNRVLKMNTFGIIEFDRVFHNIKPCKISDCATLPSTTDKVALGFTKFDGEVKTWVVLNESNYLLQLNSSGVATGCELVSNLLDNNIYTDVEFSSMDLMTNGDFTGFNARKRFDTEGVYNSKVVAKIALIDPCDSTIRFRVLTSDVTSLDSGEHNIVFGYDPVGGIGELIIDGAVKDSFELKGLVYYKPSSKPPYLIGADSGNYRSKREEQGMEAGGYLEAEILDLLISTKPQTRQLNTVALRDLSIELPTTYPISFKERVDKFFLMRPAGFKSTRYDVDLINADITDVDTKTAIEFDVANLVKGKAPIHNTLDTINWKTVIRFNDSIDPLLFCAGWHDDELWVEDNPWVDSHTFKLTTLVFNAE